ncbi:MAG: endo-1,3-alpha-glucanase family glycosylhydrolase [Parcubacteria group bacterium]
MYSRFSFWMVLIVLLAWLPVSWGQSAPTHLPPIVVSFYHLRIEYRSTSDWAEVKFLNPERILTSQVISIEGSPTVAEGSLPFLRLNRPLETINIEPEIAMTVDIAITPQNLDKPIVVQSQHGAIGGSGLRVYNLIGKEPTLLTEIDHYWLDTQNPDTSAAIFNIDLQPLSTVFPTQQQIQRSAPDKMLWAVYYPWIAWDQNASCTDHPLYPYTYNPDRSRTLDTFSRAIDQAKSAGIDGFFVSWLNTTDIDLNLSLLLEAAQEKDFHIAIYLESTPDPNDRSIHADTLKDWLVYAITTYGAHPAYMQVNGKPLIMVYNSGAGTLSVWQDIFNNLYSLGLNASYMSMSYDLSDLDLFDGLHQYAIFGFSDLSATYNALSKAVRYYSIWKDAQEETLRQKIFVATVQPGFNNCPYGENPPFVVERNDGAFFRSTFEAAVQSDPDWIMITSWNEFGENTHIEPSEHHGEQYLLITSEYAKKWKGADSLGNVNGDQRVDLRDAILALQVLCRMSSQNIDLRADIDGDGKIGMAEAIYVLEKVVGLRE